MDNKTIIINGIPFHKFVKEDPVMLKKSREAYARQHGVPVQAVMYKMIHGKMWLAVARKH